MKLNNMRNLFNKPPKEYKCPYCMNSYTKDTFETKSVNNYIQEVRCPNKAENPNGKGVLCNKKLPLNFFEGESKIISIVGGANVGKTYYSIILLKILQECQPLHKIGIYGNLITTPELKSQLELDLKNLSQQNKFSSTIKDHLRENLLIQVSIENSKKVKHIYFSLFDNPGEAFDSQEDIIEKLPNVYRSDALILLFEPKQIKPFVAEATRNSEEMAIVSDINSVMFNIIEILKNANSSSQNLQRNILNIFENNKIKIPVAICVSKFDEIETLFYNQLPNDNKELEYTILSGNKINFNFISEMSNEISSQMYNDEDGDFRLKKLIDNSLGNYSYFGVQSIKNQNGNIIHQPKGAVLPLLWIFKQLKYV
jgi:hypothetical protein